MGEKTGRGGFEEEEDATPQDGVAGGLRSYSTPEPIYITPFRSEMMTHAEAQIKLFVKSFL